jgi:thiol-disulfide isomerase/thioredoxin
MKITYIYIGIVVFVIIGLVAVRNMSDTSTTTETSRYDEFAQCLTDAGAKFYGAFWCPHCQDQKKMFENSSKIPYIECSTPNRNAQTKPCNDAGITGYPTWILADGTKLDGAQELSTLAEKTNCTLPSL